MPIVIAHIYDSQGIVIERSNFAKGERISVDVSSLSMFHLPYFGMPVSLVIQDTEKQSFSPINLQAQVDVRGHAMFKVTMPNVDAGAMMSATDKRETTEISISIGTGYAPEIEIPKEPEGINQVMGDVTQTVKWVVIVLLILAAIGLVIYGINKTGLKIPKLGR
jgi:hypothetical protein